MVRVSLKVSPLPYRDRGMSALLEDLAQRSLPDGTPVLWLAVFGRTPKVNGAAGRDNRAPCNAVVLAGSGVPGGHVVGASDRLAAYPARDPVAPRGPGRDGLPRAGDRPRDPAPRGRRPAAQPLPRPPRRRAAVTAQQEASTWYFRTLAGSTSIPSPGPSGTAILPLRISSGRVRTSSTRP